MDAFQNALFGVGLAPIIICVGGVLLGISGYRLAGRQVRQTRVFRRSVEHVMRNVRREETSLYHEHAHARQGLGVTR